MSTHLTNPPFPDAGDMTGETLLGLMVYIITPLMMMDDGTDQSEAGAGGQGPIRGQHCLTPVSVWIGTMRADPGFTGGQWMLLG